VLIELVDVLRCPRQHEETWLVASADRTEGRRIVDGTLGCPICRAEYPVRGGVADFAGGAALRSSVQVMPTAEDALRLAALLDLTPGPGFALLFGSWGSYAEELSAITPVPLMLVNPPVDARTRSGATIILAGDVLPLAAGRARAAAIDPALTLPVATQADAVRSGGRIVAPRDVDPLTGTREIARDDRLWVAERDVVPSAPVTLTARPR